MVLLLLLQRFLPVRFNLLGGLHLIWLLRRIFTVVDGPGRLPSLFNVLLFCLLPCWLPAVDKSRGSESAEVLRVWEVHDDRLQFMSRAGASLLDESLRLDDVCGAWMVWSGLMPLSLLEALFPSRGPSFGSW